MLRLLHMYMVTHKYTHLQRESQRNWVHAHTCTHEGEACPEPPCAAFQCPWVSCQLHPPTCPHPKPGSWKGFSTQGTRPPQTWAKGRRCVHENVCVHTERALRDGPGLGLLGAPSPHLLEQLLKAPALLPTHPPSEVPCLDPALPTGALAGSAPRPTRTPTDTGQRWGAGLGGWAGHHKPEQQLPGEGWACHRQPPQGGKGSCLVAWEGRESQQMSLEPSCPGLVGARAVRQLATAAWCGTWPGYANSRAYRAMYGGRGMTLHRTQTHRAPGSSAGGGAGAVRVGEDTSARPHASYLGAMKTCPSDSKLLGSRNSKSATETGGYPAGAGEAGGRGAQS